VALEVPCPHCGPRPYTEFAFGGEDRPHTSPDPETDFARVYLPANAAGRQRERWFHALGCRIWFTVTRDTTSDRIDEP
jgi:heterotetrameric sarcosine oxidase delta subunit